MANHWVVNDQKVMIACMDDAQKATCTIGSDQMWLGVPEGMLAGNAKVAGEWPELSLVDGYADKVGPKWDAMRVERNKRLAACDWTQMADSALSAQAKADWSDHRSALRNLPEVNADPENISWPVAPVAPAKPVVLVVPVEPVAPFEPVALDEREKHRLERERWRLSHPLLRSDLLNRPRPPGLLEPVEPVVPAEPVAPAEPVVPAEPVAPAEPVEPVAP